VIQKRTQFTPGFHGVFVNGGLCEELMSDLVSLELRRWQNLKLLRLVTKKGPT
jgi:hypothetical protein